MKIYRRTSKYFTPIIFSLLLILILPFANAAAIKTVFENSLESEESIAAAGGTFSTLGNSQGSHSFVPGVKGNALLVTNNNYVSFPSISNFPSNQGTISFWVKSLGGGLMAVGGLPSPNSMGFWVAPFHDINGQLTKEALVYFEIRGPNLEFYQLSAYTKNFDPEKWHNLAFSWKCNGKGSMYIYVDGKKLPQSFNGETDRPICRRANFSSQRILIGTDTWYTGGNEKILDEFKIYSKMISSSKIKKDYLAQRPR